MKSSTYVLSTTLAQVAGDSDLHFAHAIVRLADAVTSNGPPNGNTKAFLDWLDGFLGVDDPTARRMRQLLNHAVMRDARSGRTQ